VARNVENKARIACVAALRHAADTGPTPIPQDDTFFACDAGRLTLRVFGWRGLGVGPQALVEGAYLDLLRGRGVDPACARNSRSTGIKARRPASFGLQGLSWDNRRATTRTAPHR